MLIKGSHGLNSLWAFRVLIPGCSAYNQIVVVWNCIAFVLQILPVIITQHTAQLSYFNRHKEYVGSLVKNVPGLWKLVFSRHWRDCLKTDLKRSTPDNFNVGHQVPQLEIHCQSASSLNSLVWLILMPIIPLQPHFPLVYTIYLML